MEKIIKRTISLTTKKRDSRNKLFEEFYSHDKNNAIFEFTVEGGVPTEDIVVLFHFKRTNRHLEVHGRVDNDKIIVNFDTSLIIKDEQVAGYIYYENGEKSNDVYRFMFDVHVSEIDKEHDLPVMEQESKRIVPLTDIVTKSEITELLKKIVANERLYDDTEIRGEIANKADTQTVEAIARRVETLENKPDNNTVNDDNDVIHRLNVLENNASKYITEHQPLTSVEESIRQIEQRFKNLSNIYLTSHQSLQHLATNDALNKVAQRVEQLESKPEIDVTNFATKAELDKLKGSQLTIDNHNFATREELEELRNNHPVVDTSNLATNAKVEAVEERVQVLENKPTVEVDKLITKEVLEAKGYLTAEALTAINRTIGEQNTKITALQSRAEFEIHGTGMPNGRVTAPIGTTYVDTAVTNGALKWIKESGDGNTGWKVFTGDTGWRNLNIVSKLGNSFLKIRRVNNQVTYQFGGLQWGWFGIIRRGSAEYFSQPTDVERNCYILRHDGVPLGFRTPNSLIGAIYNDRGTPYGTWYVGNPADANHLRFQFSNPVPTDRDIGDIRVSSISYYTDDEWPTVLP